MIGLGKQSCCRQRNSNDRTMVQQKWGPMKCPFCGLINHPSAQICDCGYNFETQSQGSRVAGNATPILVGNRIMLPTGEQLALAGLGSRWKGQLLDAGFALILTFFAVLPLLLLKAGEVANSSTALVVYFGYLLLSDGFKGGQSLGKKIMKTAVIDIGNGKPCSFWQSFVRNIMQIFGILDWIFISGKKRRRLGDMAANTVVVQL